MLEYPGMLLLGAAGRNAGKTSYACAVLSRLAADGAPAHAVKVTVVREEQGGCPHGEGHCGACDLGGRPFILEEERAKGGNKDTARMAAAGALRTWWLRVHRESLLDAMRALLERLGPLAPVVCESNAVRLAVRPGLFLVLRHSGDGWMKPSCKEVLHYADRELRFDGTGWDLDPAACVLEGGHWRLRLPATAVILAGGKSSRMGTDKSMLAVNGVPMIEHIARQLVPLFSETIISAGDAEAYRFLGLPVVPDERPGEGPLRGVASALRAAKHDLVFVIGCDMPRVDAALIHHLHTLAWTHELVMPLSEVTGERRSEPLFAFYRRGLADRLEELLARGERRLAAVLGVARSAQPLLPAGAWQLNINTPEEYRAL